MLDPHNPVTRRKLIKQLFHGDENMFLEYLAHYDYALERGSKIPHDRAMIAFRKNYQKAAGRWARRIKI